MTAYSQPCGVADVGSPFLVGCLGEVLVEKVRCDWLSVVKTTHFPVSRATLWRPRILLVMDPLCTVALAAAPKGCPDMGE